MPTGNYNWNEIFAVSTKYLDDKITEAFSLTSPLMDQVMKNKKYVDGGNRLAFAIDYNPAQNIGFITGTAADTIPTGTQQNVMPAELDWKYLQTGFSVTIQDLNTTADSKHAITSLVTEKVKNSLASTKQFISAALYGSAADNANAFNGFGDIFAAAGTAYAGLLDTDLGTDAAGDKIWLPQYDAASTVVDYKTIEPMITKLKTKANFAGIENKLDYMVSKAAVLSAFKQNQQLQQRFLPAKDLAAGFDGINVDGVIWYADEFCGGSGTAYDLYLISSNSLKFMYKYGFDGKNSPADVSGLRIPNQPIMTHQRYITGNLACVNRRVNGKFSALNPAAVREA